METKEGLIFAVVETGLEQGAILCFLRYVKTDEVWQKLNTDRANQFLATHFPKYLYYSPFKQAHCHAVRVEQVVIHHQPRLRLQQLLQQSPQDAIETDLGQLCRLYQQQGFDLTGLGVTGSVLIAAQNHHSDIDLVCYCRTQFRQLQQLTEQFIQLGQLAALSRLDWQVSYQRRACDLTEQQYRWHEQRKLNKAVINQRKFDLSLVSEQQEAVLQYEKQGHLTLTLLVTDDRFAFDYPAKFLVQHTEIQSIVSYTATYTGQAQAGEWIEVSGQLEQASTGGQRLVVGSSREAVGEYIKVV